MAASSTVAENALPAIEWTSPTPMMHVQDGRPAHQGFVPAALGRLRFWRNTDLAALEFAAIGEPAD